MSPPPRGPLEQRWAGIDAAVDAAVRELPSRLMHVDPRLPRVAPRAEGATAGTAGAGLVLNGNWAAPARAREATRRACAEAGLHPAVAAAASVVSLRVASSAVVADAETITVRVSATGAGAHVSLRARFLAPRDLDGQSVAAVVRQRPWGLGGSAQRGGTRRHEHGGARLFGVAVDAYGILQDRADVVIWYEMRPAAH